MTHKIYFTANFKRQYKKVRKNRRWQPMFDGVVPLEGQNRSAWDYILDSFEKRIPLPDYFYVHPLHVPKDLIQRLKRDFGLNHHATIKILELHMDGHNGNHLLVYYDNEQFTVLLAIGTHSDLF